MPREGFLAKKTFVIGKIFFTENIRSIFIVLLGVACIDGLLGCSVKRLGVAYSYN